MAAERGSVAHSDNKQRHVKLRHPLCPTMKVWSGNSTVKHSVSSTDMT